MNEREQQLLNFARRLHQIGRSGDWRLAADADRELAVCWRRLSVQGEWTAAEKIALDALRRSHRELMAQCEQATGVLREQLHALTSRRDGWMAYAHAFDAEQPIGSTEPTEPSKEQA